MYCRKYLLVTLKTISRTPLGSPENQEKSTSLTEDWLNSRVSKWTVSATIFVALRSFRKDVRMFWQFPSLFHFLFTCGGNVNQWYGPLRSLRGLTNRHARTHTHPHAHTHTRHTHPSLYASYRTLAANIGMFESAQGKKVLESEQLRPIKISPLGWDLMSRPAHSSTDDISCPALFRRWKLL